MKSLFSLFAMAYFVAMSFVPAIWAAPVKIACVGDSITYGYKIPDRETGCYPAQLQRLLDKKAPGRYEVHNFGVSSMTLMRNTAKPYTGCREYRDSVACTADIVIIMLGTNDSSGANRALIDTHFEQDYHKLISAYRDGRQGREPRIIVMLPPKCFLEGRGTDENTIRRKIVPIIRKVARDASAELIDLYASISTNWKVDLMPDKLHPSAEGAGMMAEKIAPVVLKRK